MLSSLLQFNLGTSNFSLKSISLEYNFTVGFLESPYTYGYPWGRLPAKKDKIIEKYSVIWNLVELFPTWEAIQDTQQTASSQEFIFVVPHCIWVDDSVSSERMSKADNTPVQFLWIHLCCLCSRFGEKQQQYHDSSNK